MNLQSLYLTIVVKTVSFTKKDLQLTGTNFQKYGRHSLMIALFAHRGKKGLFVSPTYPMWIWWGQFSYVFPAQFLSVYFHLWRHLLFSSLLLFRVVSGSASNMVNFSVRHRSHLCHTQQLGNFRNRLLISLIFD